MKTSIKTPNHFFAAASFVGLLAFFGSADAIVYTASNEAAGNQIIAFDVDVRGNIQEIGRFDTQGLGSGAPLGNQGAITTDASDRWMFATNAGDGTLTSFRLQANGLQFVNIVPSGGYRPLSVTVFGTLVYVLNEGSGEPADPDELRYDNISGFRFTAGGVLVPIENSTRILDDTRPTAPAQIGFNKSGTVLLVTEKATNTLATFLVQTDGTTSGPITRPSFRPTPFGFSFGDRDYVFITEANGGAQGVTASYRVNRDTGEVSDLVDSLDMGNATCWTVLSSDQTVGYATNTADGTLSLYTVNFNGTLDYFFNAATDTPIATGAGVRDAVLLQNNQFLFTLNNGAGQVRSFWVNRSGAISSRSTATIPNSATGLLAR